MSATKHCFAVTIKNSAEFTSCIEIISDTNLNPSQTLSVLIDDNHLYFGLKSLDDNGRKTTTYFEVGKHICSDYRFDYRVKSSTMGNLSKTVSPSSLEKTFNCEGLCGFISDPLSKVVVIVIDATAENLTVRSGTTLNGIFLRGSFVRPLNTVNEPLFPKLSGVNLAKNLQIEVFSSLVQGRLQREGGADKAEKVSLIVSSEGRALHIRVGSIALEMLAEFHIKIIWRFWYLFSKVCEMTHGDVTVSVFQQDRALLLDFNVGVGKLSFLIDVVELVRL